MKPWVKKTLIGAGAFLLLVVAGGLGYSWYLYHHVKQTAAAIYEPIQPIEYKSKDPEVKANKTTEPAVKERIENKHPFTVLVMGVDERGNDKGRSDTLIVMAVNPNKKSILMFNIPRDTRTEIIGHGTTDKINHAYAFGGAEMSKQTVEHFLDYPIDYYIRVNMEGFAKLIDVIGGVQIDNPFAFFYEGHQFDKGALKLDGEEALLYSRMRYEDPRGDFGRNTRQREILKQVLKRALTFNSIKQIEKILDQLGSSVKTNISFDEMKTFITDYRSDLEQVDTVEISGSGSTINRVWYYIVGNGEKERIHNLLKNQMSGGDAQTKL
ncbi:LCP family glycopolymer transferase [Paenibacillus radicis (ex Gao et al. 2016)]|uniref:Transcriptional regulator LytR n=1 Tax=Paenibacillus radicis (ex Gao et al. 2016) TaxID=1737354 RepID=A0A917LX98_9BACL|nr:LCP family protein [Paenibacillus radicis (ex Gao et al. 2016)]GGG63254.1 transcriptional regulator LytR [Paenibacillus radicis (ex Gao et al. 2016)]